MKIPFCLLALVLVGCHRPNADENRDRSPDTSSAKQPLNELPLPDENGNLTIEGKLKGRWLRRQSGEILGDLSKVTILDPLRLIVGSHSLPLLGTTEEMENTLLQNTGKTVRLRGSRMKWIEHGRGVQGGQAGYSGAIPAHVVEFLIVSECDVTETKPPEIKPTTTQN